LRFSAFAFSFWRMATVIESPKAAASRLLTSEEFLEWLEPGVFADLVGGEIAMHSPVNLRHANLVNFLERLLAAYIEHVDLGELHRESVAIRLSVRETFMPDLAYFTKAQATRLTTTHAPFAPTFVMEALSPATAQNDLGRKFAAYELHGVQEYWVLDPDHLEHRFYRREGDMLSEFAMGEEVIPSASLAGFWVRRAWLNPARLSKVSACLAEIISARKPGRRRSPPARC
jgi:Uma2 family endonuclease